MQKYEGMLINFFLFFYCGFTSKFIAYALLVYIISRSVDILAIAEVKLDDTLPISQWRIQTFAISANANVRFLIESLPISHFTLDGFHSPFRFDRNRYGEESLYVFFYEFCITVCATLSTP